MTTLRLPCFCLVTDRRAIDPSARTQGAEITALEHLLDEAIASGVDLIQIRERDLEARTLRALVERVVRRAAGAETAVVVNDRADVAIAAGAAGVHLRADGPPTDRVRSLAEQGALIGRSIHSSAEACDSADYLLFGTVFPSRSKTADAPVAGLGALAAAVDAASSPVFAIGGITPTRVPACRAAGAVGIAAIGLFLPAGRTPDSLGPRDAMEALRLAWVADP